MLKEMTPTQKKLAESMSEISEQTYCAGWLIDLEFHLWHALVHREKSGGFALTEEEAANLRALSRECGGWIVFDKKTWETWLPLSEWEQRYESWLSGRES